MPLTDYYYNVVKLSNRPLVAPGLQVGHDWSTHWVSGYIMVLLPQLREASCGFSMVEWIVASMWWAVRQSWEYPSSNKKPRFDTSIWSKRATLCPRWPCVCGDLCLPSSSLLGLPPLSLLPCAPCTPVDQQVATETRRAPLRLRGSQSSPGSRWQRIVGIHPGLLSQGTKTSSTGHPWRDRQSLQEEQAFQNKIPEIL